MSNVLLQCPTYNQAGVFTTQNGVYTPTPSGLISVLPADVPGLLLAGCVPALLARSVAPNTAAAGTTQGTAAALPSQAGSIYPVTGASGTNGVVLAAGDAVTGREIDVENLSSNALLIYPPGTGTIGGAGAGVAFTTAAGKGARLVCTSGTSNAWGVKG